MKRDFKLRRTGEREIQMEKGLNFDFSFKNKRVVYYFISVLVLDDDLMKHQIHSLPCN